MELYDKAKLIDYDTQTERIITFERLKEELKNRIQKNGVSIYTKDYFLDKIDKSNDIMDLDNHVIEYLNDDIEIAFVNPTINELIGCYGNLYEIVYIDYKTHEIIALDDNIDMDVPVVNYNIIQTGDPEHAIYGETKVFVLIDSNTKHNYNINFHSLEEANNYFYNASKKPMILKCRCNECGRTFFTPWRNKYSPAPICEECQDPNFVTVEEIVFCDSKGSKLKEVNTMTEERKIELLMMDKCTKSDAEKHLKNGSTIFEGDDFEKFFNDYMKEWNIEEEDIGDYKKMITDKIPMEDWGIVHDGGKTYYIMYSL